MKIEFGEIGIENVTFSQPYVTSDSKNEITIRDLTINNKCELKLTIKDNDKHYLDESFEIIYQNSETLNPFYYQCGVLLLPITKEKQINCYYIQNELKYLKEDICNYEKSISQGKMNININNYTKNFIYYNFPEIINFFQSEITYISNERSKIILKDISKKNIEGSKTPSLFLLKEKLQFEQNNCEYLKFLDSYYLYCNISNEIISYFTKYEESPNIAEDDIFYYKLCGIQTSTNLTIIKLDETKYPIFYAEKFIIPNQNEYNSESLFILEGRINGILSENYTKDNSFSLFVNIAKTSSKIVQIIMNCSLNSIEKENEYFKAECKMEINPELKKDECSNFEILPYFIPNIIKEPYEVLFSEDFFVKNEHNGSNYSKVSIIVLIIYILFLF